jgi:eukaryotic-like serine/threonine-protein kinase
MNRTFRLAVLAALAGAALLSLIAGCLVIQLWPTLNPSSRLVWRYNAGGTIVSAPIVDDQRVYFGTLSDSGPPAFQAVDRATGRLIWRTPTSASIFYWIPSIMDGLVAFSSDDGYFIALDAATGSEQWRFGPAERGLGEGCRHCALKFRPPVLADGIIYVGSLDHHLYALDARTGQERWRFATNGSILSAPIVADGLVYAGSLDGNVYLLNAETGQEVQRFAVGSPIYGLAVTDDWLYLTNEELVAYDRASGMEKWRFRPSWRDGDSFTKPPVVAGDLVYVMSLSRLYAVHKDTGRQVWEYGRIKGLVFEPLTLVNGRIYFGDTDSYLYVVDAANGRLLQRYNLARYDRASQLNYTAEFVFSPAVVDGVIYVGWFEHLYALAAP